MEGSLLRRIIVVLAIISYAYGQDEPTCDENEEYSDCVSSCEPYCNQRPGPCVYSCMEGCRCKEGFIREAADSGRCVPVEDCKKMPKCGAFKEYHICGSACPEYCGQPKDAVCTKECVQGCQCQFGYVKLNNRSQACIPKNQCPIA